MSKNSEKVSLSEIINAHRVLRDFAQQEELKWWKWLKFISLPLLMILTLQNVAAEFGYMKELTSWFIIAAFWIALGVARLAIVVKFQRDRKYYEERRLHHEKMMSEGFTHSAMVDGKQVMFR